jgi:hypothetical protein
MLFNAVADLKAEAGRGRMWVISSQDFSSRLLFFATQILGRHVTMCKASQNKSQVSLFSLFGNLDS